MPTVDYYYTVANGNSITTTNSLTGNITLGSTATIGSTTCTVWGCGCSGYHYYTYPYHTCPPPVKLYQIFCPKPSCTGKFWAEIDEIKKCPVCKSKIKINDEPPADYEVTVN